MTTPPSCLALSGRSAQRRHICRRDAPRRVAHVEWDGHRPGRRSRMAEQPGFGGSNGPAGDAVRPRGRGEHRLPGRGGRTGRPGVDLRAGFQHRGVLGGTVARGVPPAALGVHPADPVRPPWLRAVGRHGTTATPTLEERMDDVLAVLDAVGSNRPRSLGSQRAARWRHCSRRPIRSGRHASSSTERSPTPSTRRAWATARGPPSPRP